MIYVFGSCNVDMVMRVGHHPQPGETILSQSYGLYAGGKGANQAVAAARAGAKVALIGALGQDQFSHFLKDEMAEDPKNQNLDLSHLTLVDGPTGCAVVAIDENGENTIIVSSGANFRLKAEHFPLDKLQEGDRMLLQMEVAAQANWEIVRLAKARKAFVTLNAAPAGMIPEEILKQLDLLIVNTHEISVLAPYAPTDIKEKGLESLALWGAKHFKIRILVTLGAQGALMIEPDGKKLSKPALPVEVIDTVAAGDTFVGYFAAAESLGRSPEEALDEALAASALTCTRLGAQPAIPSYEEVVELLKIKN